MNDNAVGVDWNLLKTLLAVVETGSLSAAARALQSTQPTVGRHIEILESHFDKVLFVRTPKGLLANETTLGIVSHLKKMDQACNAMRREISGKHQTIEGPIRITASEVVSVYILPQMLLSFCQSNPKIQIEISASNSIDNLLQREADIAVRMVKPTQQSIIATKCGNTPVQLFAHKTYFKKFGKPSSKAELVKHFLIGPDRNITNIKLVSNTFPELKIEGFSWRTDFDLTAMKLIELGAGIGPYQKYLAEKIDGLEVVFGDQIEFDLPIWIAMHESAKTSPRIQALYKYIVAEFRKFTEQR